MYAQTYPRRQTTHDVGADAKALRALHIPGSPLLLANIWDPATARVAESAGMKVVATTSAALAPANGYEDHGKLPAEVAFIALRRITDTVKLPVTTDLEAGYGLSPSEIVDGVIEAGACGLNIEDTDHSAGRLVDAEGHANRISAIKAAARARDIDLVVNARIDVHVHGYPTEQGLQRAALYLSAGADCIYPMLLADLRSISRYVALGPTNVLWRPGGAALRDIASAGASRISVGPILFQLMLRHMRRSMDALSRFEDHGIVVG